MIFGNPWGLSALVAIPAIIILYLLKQKHEDHVISSLYLWQNAVMDMEADAPWQRLKKNILMFIQIFAVAVMALILSEPVLNSGGGGDKAVILVMDCSLSMQSTDVKPDRFGKAADDAVKRVEACSPDTEFTLVASGNSPDILLNGVKDKDRVIREIKALKATDAAENTEKTVELVNSLIRANAEARVEWFSDGVNPMDEGNVSYYSYNGNGDNYAVTLLSYRKLQEDGGITALSRISNFSPRPAELDVSIYADGALFDARRVTVEGGGNESLYWTDIPESAGRLECRIDTADGLLKDNTAGTVISSDKIYKVLLAGSKNIFLEKVFGLMPNLELYRTDIGEAGEMKGYDLYVFDGEMPEKLPEDGYALLFNPPQNEYFTRSGESEYTKIRLSEHPFCSGAGADASFNAMKTGLYRVPEWGNILMENDGGAAAFEGYIDRKRVVVFGFDLHETNLPVQPFFPVVMTRIVQELLPGSAGGISAVYAGEAVELPVDPEAGGVSVITPGGSKLQIAPPFPAAAFDETLQTGVYTIEQQTAGGTEQRQFYVNAPSEKEFAARAEPAENRRDEGEKPSGGAPAGLSLTTPLLWLLLAILLMEWWAYTNGNSI